MEYSRDWKEKARESFLNGALQYIYLVLDVRDLELGGYYAVACLGHIMDLHLNNYEGKFEDIKQAMIEKVKIKYYFKSKLHLLFLGSLIVNVEPLSLPKDSTKI